MRTILNRHKHYWSNRDAVVSAVLGFLLLSASLVINFFAGAYANDAAGDGVQDLILDHIPVMDVSFIFVNATIFFIAAIIIICVTDPRRAPFVLKSAALFIIIRSIFITLTHIGPYLGLEYQQSYLDQDSFIAKFTFGGDLFFSGHTGMPFLLALIFWRDMFLRIFFIAASFIAASAALLGHLHYSIDVFAAYFITYSIFNIAKYFFKKDYDLLKSA